MPKTALVTGAAGFIGKHFSEYLYDRGYAVIGNDIVADPNPVDQFVVGDCRDIFRAASVGSYGYDLVVHCAAIVGGRATIDGQPLKVATDLSIDSDFFNWAVRAKPKNVIYYSSSAAYPVDFQRVGTARRLAETDINLGRIRNPDMTYGWTKLTGEMLADYLRAEGVPVSVFRPFSGYGERQSLEYPFPSFIDRVVQKSDPFEVWGTGRQERDFIHVDDVIRLSMKAADNHLPGPYNLCTGTGTSFRRLAELMFTAAGWRPSEMNYLTGNPVGVHYRVGDPTKMIADLGEPTISLRQGIERSLEWAFS